MKAFGFVTAAVAALLAACSSSDTPATTPTAAQVAPTTSSSALTPVELVFWNDFFAPAGVPGPQREALVESLAAQAEDEPAYRAFLVDLAIYGFAYREQAWELLGSDEPFSSEAVLGFFQDLAPADPADDPPGYGEFKARILGTIQLDFETFLDPDKEHLISAQEVVWGGVPVDGIPPLEEPGFVTAEEAADWILPSDLVIGVEINGDARAYPRRIIDWHEMVNDTIGGVPVSLAYCTLCGSAILYDGRVGDEVFRFGTSGLLYRSNKLMYDRATRTLWEQYTGEPVWGELAGSGIQLEFLPAVHVTWEEWLADHPDTRVLDIETGFSRDYGSGVAYADYWATPDLYFPVPDEQGPLAAKDVVFSLRLGGETVAYPVDLVAERGFVLDRIAGTRVVVVSSEDGSGARAYEAADHEFVSMEPDGVLADASGAAWRVTEDVLVAEDGTELARLPGHNSFWFAVTNHATDWRLYEE